MNVPRATYRLQFHPGFTLRDALALVPYLDSLGISHIYASPLLEAQPGSTHGYDVCDPHRIRLDVGSESDLEALAQALHERGMGLALDIVPNHMAAAPENPWWWDVLKHGRESRFADFFDIDWNPPDPRLRGRILLPVLGDELERVLERGELKVIGESGQVEVRYFEHRFPASPPSILDWDQPVEAAAARVNSDRGALARFLGRQHYELAFWRHGDARLNYRRFFTVTQLAALRVELPQVFANTHERVFRWRQRGWIDGFRVDHPDGLRDPLGYLERLGRAAPDAWIVVEKILEPGEDLPPDWPVAGTTGYDFLNRALGLLVHSVAERPLTAFYAEFTHQPADFAALARTKKRQILCHDLAAEVSRLASILEAIRARCAPDTAVCPDRLREGLIEILACFPVYRTYCRAEDRRLSPRDEAPIAEAFARALRAEPPPSPAVLALLDDLLHLRLPGHLAREFVMRFQQLTGPAMAKGIEDTAFYCYNRLIALNEVGGDPGRFGLSVDQFHSACVHARQHWPAAMLATSTHDTKRGEDTRARLAILSEIPDRWIAAVRRWSAMNEKHRRSGWPDPNAEYFFYQTLIGAWPLPLERALACMAKAAREAKQHTNWTDHNAAYEAALSGFVTRVWNDPAFMEDAGRFAAPLVRGGWINSLTQTLLKLTAPGVPDIYQGAELGDFSLMDPDNRRPVDFARRGAFLSGMQHRWEHGGCGELLRELLQKPDDGRIKLFVIARTLQHRRLHPALFREGSHVPLIAAGKHAERVCSFARVLAGTAAITVAPRRVLELAGKPGDPPVGKEIWEDTRLALPGSLAGRPFRNVLTGESICPEESAGAWLEVGAVLGRFPVALLDGSIPAAPTTDPTDTKP